MRLAVPDQARQALRPGVAGNEAEVDFRLAQLRRVGGEPQRARHRELAPAAERVAVDRGDHRLAEVLDQVEDVLPGQRVFAAGRRGQHGELVDVGAGDERLVAGSGHDDRPHAIVLLEFEHGAAQLVERLGVEGVQNPRPVDA